MDVFLSRALAPFALLVLLVIAWPIKRLVDKKMKDSPLKRRLFARLDE